MSATWYLKTCQECGKTDAYRGQNAVVCRHCHSEGLDRGGANTIANSRKEAMNQFNTRPMPPDDKETT